MSADRGPLAVHTRGGAYERRRSAALSALARHRRLTATALAAAATGFALVSLRPPQPTTAEVLAAARDLPAGTVLRSPDLRTVRLPVSLVPAGIIAPGPAGQVTGRMLSGPMRRGEPLTDARLLHSGMLRGYGDGVVATPIRVADAAVARLLRPGDRVDVLLVADHLDVPGGIDPAAAGFPSPDPADPADRANLADPADGADRAGAAQTEPTVSEAGDGGAAERSHHPGHPTGTTAPGDLGHTEAGPPDGQFAPTGRARLLATAVPVITVPRTSGGVDAEEGAIVVLATYRDQSTVLTGARGLLSVTVVSGPAAAQP